MVPALQSQLRIQIVFMQNKPLIMLLVILAMLKHDVQAHTNIQKEFVFLQLLLIPPRLVFRKVKAGLTKVYAHSYSCLAINTKMGEILYNFRF
jgi:hypothetical protein